jgi:hypothetical protein
VDEQGKVKGRFAPTGFVPAALERMRSFGVTMPKSLFKG